MSEKAKKPQEEESGESAPLWIVSFADMISLLMAFFVMLTTFASFGPKESEVIRGIQKVAIQPNYGMFASRPKSAMGPKSKALPQNESGSEKPTLEQNSDKTGMKETPENDFRNKKVFLFESKVAFWANGTSLSKDGRDFLDTLALFIREMPSRIIISESDAVGNVNFGISRAIVVMNYLVEKGISADSCNISAKSISPPENFGGERMLEIVLLDKGISG